jgi:transcriptional regulator with XRE-family HTH domain
MRKQKRITRLREERGWSQRELSMRTGIHAPTISQIENGIVQLWPGYAKRIAKAFGVSVDEVTGQGACRSDGGGAEGRRR